MKNTETKENKTVEGLTKLIGRLDIKYEKNSRRSIVVTNVTRKVTIMVEDNSN